MSIYFHSIIIIIIIIIIIGSFVCCSTIYQLQKLFNVEWEDTLPVRYTVNQKWSRGTEKKH